MPLQVEAKVNVKDLGPITRYAVTAVSRDIRERSRLDLARAGMPVKWQKGLKTRVDRFPGGYRIKVSQTPGYAKVFEKGGTSVGKPMLWIPAPDLTIRTRARKYPGKLWRPPGKKVLLGRDGKVKYIGAASITNRKRTHIGEIAMEEAQKFIERMAEVYRA